MGDTSALINEETEWRPSNGKGQLGDTLVTSGYEGRGKLR
jgi:hypothetical protein